MKSLNYFFLVALFSLLISCKQAEVVPYYGVDFLFKEPQPINDNELKKLPNEFLGTYLNNDSTYLIISDKVICYKHITKSAMSNLEFESLQDSVKMVGNKLYVTNQKKYYDYRKIKDSIEITDTAYDTLFTFSNSNIAKRIKGAIVLNQKDSIYWKIKVLRFNNDTLNITSLVSKNDLARIDSLAKTKVQKIDSTKNVIELSKTEFKKLLSMKKIGYVQEYKKLAKQTQNP